MTDIEQALAEALVAYRVDGKYQVWDDFENAEEYFGTPQELAHGMAATEPMQAIARDAAVGRAVQALQAQSQEYRIEAGPTWYEVQIGVGPRIRRDTLQAAIAAALGDDQ